MEKEYKFPLKHKIIYSTPTLIVLGVCIYFIYQLIYGSNDDFNFNLVVLIAVLTVFIILLSGSVTVVTYSCIISENYIQLSKFGRTKRLEFDEIKGIEQIEGLVVFVPNNKKKKSISFDKRTVTKTEELKQFADRLPNLTLEEYEKEEKTLYADEKYGVTPETRRRYLDRIRLYVKILNITSLPVCFWIITYPYPYDVAILIGIILPIIGLIIAFTSNDLVIALDHIEFKKRPHPNISGVIVMPQLAICIRAIMDYDIFDYTNVWIYTICLSPILFYLTFKASKTDFHEKITDKILMVLFNLGFFGWFIFSDSIVINCVFDYSEPVKFTTTAIDKKIDEGNNATFYYVYLEEVGPFEKNTEIKITEEEYDALEEGSQVTINLKKGLLAIPWMYITFEDEN